MTTESIEVGAQPEAIESPQSPAPRGGGRRWALPTVVLAVLAGLLVVPLAAAPTWLLLDMSHVGILGIFGLSVGLLMGGPRMISLGHAGILMVGAYGTALMSIHVTSQLWITLLVAALCGAVTAALMAAVALRNTGVFFMMVTLALGQLLFVLAGDWDAVTGGQNGLGGIPAAKLGGLGFTDASRFYVLVFVFAVALFYVVGRIMASPYGQTLRAIGANEERALAVGYRTSVMKVGAFILSGAIAGVAGGLLVYLDGFVTPSLGHWSSSAEALLIVIVGGVGSVVGPIVGSSVLFLLEEELSVHTDLSALITGVVFILFVLFIPGGLVGLVRRLWEGLRS